MKKFGLFICCILLLIMFSFFTVSNAQVKDAVAEEEKLAAANEVKGEVEADPLTEKLAELQDGAGASAPGGAEASAPGGAEASAPGGAKASAPGGKEASASAEKKAKK